MLPGAFALSGVSTLQLRRRLGALLALFAVIGSAALVTAPGASAATPPVLDTVSVNTTQVTTPGNVTLSYTAHADAPITQVLAGYTDEAGRAYSVTLTPGTSGSGVLKLPDGVRNGLWQLQYVFLTTGGVDRTYVCRTGRVNPGCTEFRDLSAYDVTVSGSTWDTAAPVVSAMSITPQQVPVGTQVTVSLGVDEVHTLTRVSLTLQNPAPEAKGDTFTLVSVNATDLADGQFSATVPASAYDGTYVATVLVVGDSVGNLATYRPHGMVTLANGATAPTSHSLDFASTTLGLTDSTHDVVPPTLTAIQAGPATAAVAKPVTVGYATTDDKSALSEVTATWRRADGTLFTGSTPAQPATVGQFTSAPSQPGEFQLWSVRVVDSAANVMTYRRDGTTLNTTSGANGTHSLDFSAADLRVLPSQVLGLAAIPHPRAIVLQWGVDPREVADLTGYRVTIQPGNRVVDVPVPTGNLNYPAVTTRIDGLDNGRRYSFSVVGRASVGDGAPGTVAAAPMMSDRLFAFGGPGPLFNLSDSNWDGRTDLFAVSSKDATVYRYLGNGRAGFTGGRQLLEQQVPGSRVVTGGSLAGGGFPTFLVVDHGTLEVHGTMIDGSVYTRTHLGGGWGSMRFIDGSSDFTGDQYTDVLAVTATGELRLYPGGYGTLGTGRTIGTGWGSMLAVFSPGDLSGDRRPDVVAVDATGGLWLFRGNGRGGLGTGTKIGSGWAGFGAVLGARDLSGDGRMDLAAVTMTGDLLLYAGRGNGTFASARKIGTGWGAYL